MEDPKENEEKVTKVQKTTDLNGDGKEDVSEYIERKKTERESEEEQEKEALGNVENKDKSDEEKIKNFVGTASNIISVVPHFAAFGAGMALSDKIKKLIEMGKGE
jgi:hypothetical protein